MVVVGKHSFKYAGSFLRWIPEAKRCRILRKLRDSLGGVYSDPGIAKWITENYRNLDSDQLAIVKQCQEVTQEFSYHLL